MCFETGISFSVLELVWTLDQTELPLSLSFYCCVSVCLFVRRCVHPSVRPSVRLSVRWSVGRSVGRSVGPSVRPSVPSVRSHPSVCLFLSLLDCWWLERFNNLVEDVLINF